MKRKLAKVKPINPKRRKKAKKRLEIVTKCDHCGKSIGQTCARTDGSAVIAGGENVIPGKINGKWMFYCCLPCAEVATELKSVVWCHGDSMVELLKKERAWRKKAGNES